MKRLEAVYLANVILYLPSIETIIKLIKVNKKCHQAAKIIRCYEKRKQFESDCDGEENSVVVKNLFDLFPNVETIKCNCYDVKNNLELFGKVNQIELNCGFEGIELPQIIRDKVIKLNIETYSLGNHQIKEFVNVKKVKVEYQEIDEGYLKEFIGDTQIKLDQLIIKTKDNEELGCLKEFKNIENKIIKIESKITKERFEELKSFANTVLTQFLMYESNVNFSMNYYYNELLLKESDINRIYDLTLFTQCYLEKEYDLRNCEFLEEIIAPYFLDSEISIQIKGLKYLKKFYNIKKVDCFPSSLTKITFKPSFDYKELLEKDNNCFNNIKEIKLEIGRKDIIEDNKMLINFKNCTTIELLNASNQLFEFPLNVKELILGYCSNKDQLGEIGKLKGLKKLSIEFNSIQNKQQIQEMYDNLNELERLNTNYVETIELPLTITYLNLTMKYNADLRQQTNLKEIEVNFAFGNKEIFLPPKLNKLYIVGKVNIKNIDEIEVDKLILDNTSFQLNEWKSKDITIY